ncbi:MAG: FAD-dependent oxidoreductase [Chloroflexi bacterium]|nr:FAD-dependent oxidoreductase [Chloroflexota bacterium]MCL5734965.1 FAD-dependent oxidoreductase [Actinomycetota bacterium]
MKALGDLGIVHDTEVLIVGGGIAGLTAAIATKEKSPATQVLVVEKNFSGWAGQANKGAGVFMFLGPDDPVERFLDYHTHNIGCFLEDQELLALFAAESQATIENLDSWCHTFCRNADGSLAVDTFKPGLPWRLAAAEHDTQMKAQRYAKRLGVDFLEKTMVVDVLKEGAASGNAPPAAGTSRAAGAIGFSLLDGSCHLFRAKAVILATGGQSYRIMSMWNGARGDGIAAAYRTGAQVRNAEFGAFMQLVNKRSKEPLLGAEDALYNAKGECLSSWRREFEPDVDSMAGAVWYREMLAGNGPIVTHNDENWLLQHTTKRTEKGGHGDDTPELWNRPKAEAFWERLLSKTAAADGRGPVSEVFPGFLGEFSPVRVDHQMATTVAGLYAIGNTATSGCAMAGAVPASPGRIRGKALTSSAWMGIRAGAAVLDYVGEVPPGQPDADLAAALKKQIFAPLRRHEQSRGPGLEPIDLVRQVQAAIAPVGYSIYKKKGRMEEALGLVLEAQGRIPELSADDPHHLAAANEARAMILCAEMFYRASLAREESRGWHLREDFPERNDAMWLKWILLQDQDGEMHVSTEEVPVHHYPFQP